MLEIWVSLYSFCSFNNMAMFVAVKALLSEEIKYSVSWSGVTFSSTSRCPESVNVDDLAPV